MFREGSVTTGSDVDKSGCKMPLGCPPEPVTIKLPPRANTNDALRIRPRASRHPSRRDVVAVIDASCCRIQRRPSWYHRD
jgi:hypothetical protein